jgi:hypothetical protein
VVFGWLFQAIVAMFAREPLRNLNASSAKAGSWEVKVLRPVVGQYTYGKSPSEKTQHFFECILVSDDPKEYIRGIYKSAREADVKK